VDFSEAAPRDETSPPSLLEGTYHTSPHRLLARAKRYILHRRKEERGSQQGRSEATCRRRLFKFLALTVTNPRWARRVASDGLQVVGGALETAFPDQRY